MSDVDARIAIPQFPLVSESEFKFRHAFGASGSTRIGSQRINKITLVPERVRHINLRQHRFAETIVAYITDAPTISIH
jgi:hypothetical protein